MVKEIPNPKFCKLSETAAFKLNKARNILQNDRPKLTYTDSDVIEESLNYFLEIKECTKNVKSKL